MGVYFTGNDRSKIKHWCEAIRFKAYLYSFVHLSVYPINMRSILLLLGFANLVLIACTSNKTESAQADSTSGVTDTLAVAEEDADMTGGSTLFQSQQNDLNAFMKEFDGLKRLSDKIVFDAGYDLGSFTRICHFVDGKFRFFQSYEGGEGGYEETTLMRMQPGKESVVRTGSETQGFFKLVDRGSTEWFKAAMDNQRNLPVIEDFTEPIEYGAEALLKEMISKIIENKDKFTLADGRYEWYQRKEKVNSEYGGETEVYEVFRIDAKLFEMDFAAFLPKSQ